MTQKKSKLYKMKISIAIILVFILSTTALTGCVSSKESFQTTGFYFDTVVTITLYGESKEYSDEIMDLCSSYEKVFDRFDPESTLSELNSAGNFSGSADLVNILTAVDEFSVDGSFNATVASLLDLWGFGVSENVPAVPSDESIKELLDESSIYGYSLDAGNSTVVLNDGTTLELGGVAKGYVGDRIVEHLEFRGVERALISLGTSTMMLYGSKPDGSDYKIGLQTPFAESGTYDYILQAHDVCVSTSGSYERYFEEDGKIYHQILDMRTGYPAESGLNAVTVITDRGDKADILSTSLFILGYDKAIEYVESHDDVEAIFFDTDNNITLSSGLTLTDNVITRLQAASQATDQTD